MQPTKSSPPIAASISNKTHHHRALSMVHGSVVFVVVLSDTAASRIVRPSYGVPLRSERNSRQAVWKADGTHSKNVTISLGLMTRY